MADPTRYYDLMLLLDPESPEPARTKVIDQIRGQIGSGEGDLKGDADWGLRRLAYEIDHRPEAHYHLFQFEARNELLDQLNRNLSIDDAVLRYRIIRLPGEPPAETPRLEPPSRPPTPIAEPTAEEGGAPVATEAPPAEAPAVEAPPVEAPPADAPPADAPPVEAPPVEKPAAPEAPPADPAAAETSPAEPADQS